MKLSHFSGSLLAASALAFLAACGGGGGGGATPPGPGGGGGPTPPPSTPTPTSSSSPKPTPTPTSTSSPSGGNVPANMQVNVALAYDGPVSNPQQGYQNGNDGWYKAGTTVPGDTSDGDTATGGTGSNTVDGNIACSLKTEPNSGYNVTAYIGILSGNGSALPSTTWEHSGVSFALPDGLGMLNPNEPSNPIDGGQITSPGPNGCYYNIHADSESGLIHLQNPSASQVTGDGPGTAMYSLQNVLDVWGMTPATIGAAVGATGSATILAGTPSTTVNGNDEVTSYTVVSDPSKLMLSRHTAVWIIYGGVPQGGPPAVEFPEEI